MIKAAFFDIDRTLLSHVTNCVPDSARRALELLRRNGILVFPATGRPRSVLETMPALQGLPFDGGVTLTGQYCYDRQGVIYRNPIHRDDIKTLIDFLEGTPVPCCFIEGDRSYINFYTDHVKNVHIAVHSDPPPLGDLRWGLEAEVYQIWLYLDDNKVPDLPPLPHIKYTQWHEGGVDMISMDGGKSKGIEKVLAHYGLTSDEAIAFGDSDNDLDMLQAVKIAVAMGNACEEAKEAADYITTDVDDDGIWKALKHFELI
jgi:Cof subfamily protein (haloacid dehalogenase superfamily)